MQETALLLTGVLVILYFTIDRWMVTPKYFAALYILFSALIVGLTV